MKPLRNFLAYPFEALALALGLPALALGTLSAIIRGR